MSTIYSKLTYLLPEISIVVLIIVLLSIELILQDYKKIAFGVVLLLGFIVTFFYCYQVYKQVLIQGNIILYRGLLIVDVTGLICKIILLVICFWIFLLSYCQNSPQVMHIGAYSLFILGVLLSGFFLTMSYHWLMVYLSLACMSLCSVLLFYFSFDSKVVFPMLIYMLYGMVIAAIMLFGIAYLYGFTGTLAFNGKLLFTRWPTIPMYVVLGSSILAMGGLFWKLAIVPFHFWMPIIYKKISIPVMAYVSTVPKLASMVVMIRLVNLLPIEISISVQKICIIIAIVSITFGHIMAFFQKNICQVMAYSSIAQSGMMMACIATGYQGMQVALLYGIIYIYISLVVFSVIQLLYNKIGSTSIVAYQGLGRVYPLLGLGVLLGIIALVGLPPTVGFLGKLYVFLSLWKCFQDSGSPWMIWLLLTVVVNTVIALFYHIKIIYIVFSASEISNRYINNTNKNYLQESIVVGLALLLIIYFFKSTALSDLLSVLWN